jgi:hypothetical protein
MEENEYVLPTPSPDNRNSSSFQNTGFWEYQIIYKIQESNNTNLSLIILVFTMGTGAPFPEGKAQPGRDADRSPPPSAEVVNK